MSDLGFDTVASTEADAALPHPLRTARDLIAGGDSRKALDLLSEQHDALADDPEYLIACSEAWWAEGELRRAQQALLGAARLRPEDPAPLLLLSELLRHEGELDKAERVLAKAERLGVSRPAPSAEDLPPEQPSPDDLIAVAELQERQTRVRFTPKRLLFAVAGLVGISGLLIAIGRVTDPDAKPASAAAEPVLVPAAQLEPTFSVSSKDQPVVESTSAPAAAVERTTAQESPREVANVPTPTKATKAEKAQRGHSSPAVTSAVTKSRRRRPSKRPARRPQQEPPPLLALTTSDAKALTAQGDALHANGQTGLAATYFRRALEVDPDYAPALVSVGRSILRAEKYEEVFANATRALQLARGVDSRPGLEAEAIYQLGRVHLSRGNLDAARRLFRQSTTLPAAPAAAWFYLGEALASDNSPASRNAYEAYLLRVSSGHLAERARRAIQ